MARDPESIVFEAEYWLAIVKDVNELNDQIGAAASKLVSGPVGLLGLALLVRTDRDVETLATVQSSISGGLETLAAMQGPVIRLLELANGRLKALRDEAGL